MRALPNAIRTFVDEDGAVTSIEYALIAMLIALVIIVSVRAVGETLSTIFDKVASSF
ncbi:Flp family type IVb pilin [Cupriavidus cauae]|uniref:Flp family type IVb pilin n=1 Tax=Cupriavidus cauae TaxID=2608999 RepID=A0A5M8AP82_9BURK|nr:MULTISPECIES: Flp family type IVb pilin [Cupriavidus]KAA0182343.1 Flp family type IVb pilin [Cupriavidus gilardii]KAA6122554.1 Flp family type IVb pilin [Cupriavidus cauae]MCA7084323.1 Flp family type IVb pilin [Cupriavidus sp. DB3]UZN48979.1 Flp family type IVb pilin [Cupriavidus cauae]